MENTDPLDDFLSHERISTSLHKLEERVDSLERRNDLLLKILADTRATLYTQAIRLHASSTWKFENTDQLKLTNILNRQISYLRGSLDGGALPEDAFRKWSADTRENLKTEFPQHTNLWDKYLPESGDCFLEDHS